MQLINDVAWNYSFIIGWFLLLFVDRGMVDASGDQFVAYFLPSNETLGKRKRDQETATDYMDEEE